MSFDILPFDIFSFNILLSTFFLSIFHFRYFASDMLLFAIFISDTLSGTRLSHSTSTSNDRIGKSKSVRKLIENDRDLG